jgi:hypothetical protein
MSANLLVYTKTLKYVISNGPEENGIKLFKYDCGKMFIVVLVIFKKF